MIQPTEAMCRAYMEEGEQLTKEKSYDKARDRFHTARLRCANPLSLVKIARTYQEQADLPRALAYSEEFLAVAAQEHEWRAVMEKAVTEMHQLVPVEQRISIVAELSAEPAPPVAPPVTTNVRQSGDLKGQLNKNVDAFDWESTAASPPTNSGAAADRGPSRGVGRKIERASGFFVGANLAYATSAKIAVANDNMNGTVEFPTVFAAELQAGYRFFPFLSVALVPQMLFNLRPNQEDPAKELEVFVQTTGHLVLKRQWDLGLFVAPGYSVLILPNADNAHGLAVRWGGGPMFHLTKQISFAAEFSHQIGFQGAKRESGNVDMETSFFTLLAGIRFRL